MKKMFRWLLTTAGIWLLGFLTGSLHAQDFIDEDFLDNIETNARFIFTEPAAAFAVTAPPAKWNDASAVVMGYKRSILFDKKSSGGFFTARQKNVFFFEKVRFKIQLHDRHSVQSFSEIYFRYSTRDDGFVARIVKADGSLLPVNLKEAVQLEPGSDIPEFFKSFFDQTSGAQSRYYKVAIPNLEPGDILEYASYTKSKLDVRGSGYVEFDPQYEVCSKGYPIMYNEIDIETDDKSFFKSLSLNGAPEFKKENADDKDYYRYVFTDRDRDVEKDVNFVNRFLVYPIVKFQVIYANSENVKGLLIGGKGELKNGFNKEELALRAYEHYTAAGSNWTDPYNSAYPLFYACQEELKKMGSRDWSDQQFINNAYFLIRDKVVFRSTYLPDRWFAFVFSLLLTRHDIKNELVISTNNTVGKLKDVLFDDEIRYAVKVKDQLYFNCTDHSLPGELVQTLLGNEAYIITEPDKRKRTQEITPIILPNASAAENAVAYVINASLSTDFTTLQVARKSSYQGMVKTSNISTAMRLTTYMVDDYKSYGGSSPTDKMKPREQEEYEKSIKAIKEEFKKAKPDFVKENLEREFQQKITFKDFKILSDGRTEKKKELVYIEDFELPGQVRKAGKKYLVNLSSLIGPQLQVKKEERERKYDINVGYARTINWVINFKIPEGYTAAGIAELATNVENETGRFSCTGKEEGGNIVLSITKVYKQANIAKDKWKDMLAFIDAAYNTSYKYILLKPKG
ncbi:MAG TPA: hypothetical protein VL307_19580 [Chitinophagaceae bacterium]|nr:hypothetical protein [Chitinophagaceae bacterium]